MSSMVFIRSSHVHTGTDNDAREGRLGHRRDSDQVHLSSVRHEPVKEINTISILQLMVTWYNSTMLVRPRCVEGYPKQSRDQTILAFPSF